MFCSKCGKEMEIGYGLAGGGFGPYFYCTTKGCDGFVKFQDPEEPDADEENVEPTAPISTGKK